MLSGESSSFFFFQPIEVPRAVLTLVRTFTFRILQKIVVSPEWYETGNFYGTWYVKINKKKVKKNEGIIPKSG